MPHRTRRRPIILGIVGDSATGKTTLSRGIAQILGTENAIVLCTDDYHRYNRQQRKELGITPLDPECNYLDIMAQHLRLLRAGEPVLMPYYDHASGDFGPSQYIAPRPFIIVEGLLGMYWQQMRDAYSVCAYLDPPEGLRHHWKVRRDTTQRGYTEGQVFHELTLRERDSSLYIQPQRNKADVIVSFFHTRKSDYQESDYQESDNREEDDTHLNVRLTLHGTLHHPDFSEVIAEDTSGCVRSRLGREEGRAVEYLEIDGSIPDEPARALERCILDHLDDAGIDSIADLGFYYDPETRHSHPLALTQLFLVYHLLRAQHHDEILT